MVSTDDDEIAILAKTVGANVPFMRSASASDDHASTADVITEVLGCYKDRGHIFDYFCCIYPTAPFITSKKLQTAFELLQLNKADSVIPVVKFSYPPQRCFIIDNCKLNYRYREYINDRSQDLEPLYHDCGQFYFMRIDAFIREKHLVTSNTTPFVLSELEVQDIDNEEDWKIAEMKYKIMKRYAG